MNRWLFLLALPYVVSISSGIPEYCNKFEGVQLVGCAPDSYEATHAYVHILGTTIDCRAEVSGKGCEWIYDEAEALNEAHSRRFAAHSYDDFTREEAIQMLTDRDFLGKERVIKPNIKSHVLLPDDVSGTLYFNKEWKGNPPKCVFDWNTKFLTYYCESNPL